MGTPTTNGGDPATKSLRCSTEVHERIMRLVDERGSSVDMTLRHLTDESTVRIPMMPGQRERWETAAAENGQPLAVWIVAHVEAALHYGADRGSIERLLKDVTEIKRHFGIAP